MGNSIIQQLADDFLIGMLMNYTDKLVIIATSFAMMIDLFQSVDEVAWHTAKVKTMTVPWDAHISWMARVKDPAYVPFQICSSAYFQE